MQKILRKITTAALALGIAATSAAAADEDLKITVEALKARLKDQQLQIAELRRLAEDKASKEDVKTMVQDHLASSPMEMPDWLKDFKIKGDMRLRYQHEQSGGDKDRNRFRFRARLGLEKSWLDGQLKTAIRLATGSSADPTSTNQTMDDSFAQDEFWLDRAYAVYTPNCVKGLTIAGGKVFNPLQASDMVWDSDINPEGFWAQYKLDAGSIKPFANVGYFIIDENSGDHDISLTSYEAGFDADLGCAKWTTAGTFYYYEDLPYHVLEVFNKLKFKVSGTPVEIKLDYAKNFADEAVFGITDKDQAYAGFIKIGTNKKKGDFSASYKYAYIEANSVPALNDSDFGFVNRKGHCGGVKYNITKFLTTGAKVFCVQDIDGSANHNKEWLGQFDLEFKF